MKPNPENCKNCSSKSAYLLQTSRDTRQTFKVKGQRSR